MIDIERLRGLVVRAQHENDTIGDASGVRGPAYGELVAYLETSPWIYRGPLGPWPNTCRYCCAAMPSDRVLKCRARPGSECTSKAAVR